MKKKLISVLVCAAVSLAGCNKIKDATSRDFTVNGVEFGFTAVTTADAAIAKGATKAAGETSTFSVTRTVNISEIGDSDIIEYANKISKVAVNSSTLSVTTDPSGSYIVENLTVSAVGVSGSPLVIPSYTLGGAFTSPAGMNDFTAGFIMKLLRDKSVTVTVSGETNAPANTEVNIIYDNDLLFTASLL